MYTPDTIAALATPPGRGGIAVIRVSGPDAPRCCEALSGSLPAPREARFRRFRDAEGEVIDEGLVVYFPAPDSFTGEAVVELHGHGGPVAVEQLLERLATLGARPAGPGEFSLRAFLNGRLDLAQAEAIADLIESRSREASRAAVRSLQGELSARVTALVDALTDLRVYVEAALDFPDEDVDFLADDALEARLVKLRADFAALTSRTEHGRRLHDGLTLVIAGPPNAGKSSVLNRLAGSDAAIVTDIAGTTRDVLREALVLDGVPVNVVDTAGLRDSDEPVEREGIRRALAEAERADGVLLVVDGTVTDAGAFDAARARVHTDAPVLVVVNKTDLAAAPMRAPAWAPDALLVSARTGEGFAALTDAVLELAGVAEAAAAPLAARGRHIDALRRAAAHLEAGAAALFDLQAGELLAEELRLAQDALGEITGKVHSDALLGRIFASFCIGK